MNTSGLKSALRILLVEDHHDTAEAFAKLLRMRGFRVEIARRLGDAADLARKLPFDLLLCDLDLPDGDGCQLLHRMRGELGMDALRAIAISGHGLAQVVQRAQAAGFDAFVLKPMVPDRFFSLMEQVFRSDSAPPATPRPFLAVLTQLS